MGRTARRTGVAATAALVATVAAVLSTLPETAQQHRPAGVLAAAQQHEVSSLPPAPSHDVPPPPPPPVSTQYVPPPPPGEPYPSTSAPAPATSTAPAPPPAAPPGAAPPGAQPAPAHPGQDYAGAEIARREGTSRAGAAPLTTPHGQLPGLDVSGYQANVNWSQVAANGARFAYVKDTEGTTYRSPQFNAQYDGARTAGVVRGAYHFALPNTSTGTAQAEYFLAHGGGWTRDGRTLPPALDMEYNPYGADCYGLSPQAMVAWVRSFSDRIHQRTGRYPVIYTSTRWWNKCTANSPAFGDTNPLWIPRYGSSIGALPAGWATQTIWQFANSGKFPGDQNIFNGADHQLNALARG